MALTGDEGPEEMIFEQRLQKGKEARDPDKERCRLGKSQCKGPGAGLQKSKRSEGRGHECRERGGHGNL